jgi:hypothetical protein
VLIVPEDPTYNGSILNPLVRRMLETCGKPNAKVVVLANPKASGYEHAKSLLPEIAERYAHFDILLFLVDADGHNRDAAFAQLEANARQAGVRLLCCAAVQEIEAWLLAGHLDKLETNWAEIRNEVSVKERFFMPFLQRYGDSRRASGGRDLLMIEALANYGAILQRCPELNDLRERLCQALAELP